MANHSHAKSRTDATHKEILHDKNLMASMSSALKDKLGIDSD